MAVSTDRKGKRYFGTANLVTYNQFYPFHMHLLSMAVKLKSKQIYSDLAFHCRIMEEEVYVKMQDVFFLTILNCVISINPSNPAAMVISSVCIC